jgi:hypothetical protein
VECFCRGSGSGGNSSSMSSSSTQQKLVPTPADAQQQKKQADAYTTRVVTIDLQAGQSILLITATGGLMLPAPPAPAVAAPSSPSSSSTAAVAATSEAVIVCAGAEGPEGLNPRECEFTAPAFGIYSFVWVRRASFDLVKIGDNPLESAYIGDRLGMFFEGCCGVDGAEPCEFTEAPFVRYADTCDDDSATIPIPGGPGPGPPPSPPPAPACVPDPGPDVVCCSLEPSGACQRPCCCTFNVGDPEPEFVEAYCRGSSVASNRTATPTSPTAALGTTTRTTEVAAAAAMPEVVHRRMDEGFATNYPGLTLRLDLDQGQRVLLFSNDDGLM